MRRCGPIWLIAGLFILGCGPGPEWRAFASPEGGYQVEMPAEVKHREAVASTPLGEVQLFSETADSGGFVCVAAHFDLPAEVPAEADGTTAVDGVLASLSVGPVNAVRGQFTRQDEVNIAGRRGRDFSFIVPGKNVRCRGQTVLDGRRVHQFLCCWPDGSNLEDDAVRFLGSVRWVEKKD